MLVGCSLRRIGPGPAMTSIPGLYSSPVSSFPSCSSCPSWLIAFVLASASQIGLALVEEGTQPFLAFFTGAQTRDPFGGDRVEFAGRAVEGLHPADQLLALGDRLRSARQQGFGNRFDLRVQFLGGAGLMHNPVRFACLASDPSAVSM